MRNIFRPKGQPASPPPGTGPKPTAAPPQSAALLDEVQRRRHELEARLAALDERAAVITRGQYEP